MLFETDLAFPNVFVAIDPRSERGLGIVEMQCRESIQSDHAVEFAKHFLHSGFAADVVTGGEDVGGVEANTEPFRFAHVFDDRGQMLELVTQTRSLAGRRFERDVQSRSSIGEVQLRNEDDRSRRAGRAERASNRKPPQPQHDSSTSL